MHSSGCPMSKLVANILCHNDLVYMQNLIPTVKRFCDRIIVVDDCSTDGSREYLRCQGIEVLERKFDLNFSNQRNHMLQEVENGEWVFRIDSDEVPSDRIVKDIRGVVEYFDKTGINRTAMPIYHLTSFGMCKVQMGNEIRLFQKNSTCMYQGKFHEEMHADFGQKLQAPLPEHLCLLHFKHFDKNRIKYTEDFFLPNALYELSDWQERRAMESTYLPPFVTYTINETLKNYLCSNRS